jgi:hypothetical protein
MPFGLLLMIGFSVIVYRRARSVGRRPWMCVPLLWILAIGVGFIGTLVGAVLLMLGSDHELTEQEVRSALFLPTAIAMIVGAALSIWGSGRVPGDAAEPAAPDDSSGMT